MASCQVCYEEFSTPDASPPRMLTCSHVLCTKCLQNDFVDDTFYCPECYLMLTGKSINDISKEIPVTEVTPVLFIDDSAIDYEAVSSPVDKISGSGPIFQRGFCSVPGCSNREIENNLCLRHSGRTGDLNEADRLAADLKNASFNIKTGQGNRIEAAAAHKELTPDEMRLRFQAQGRISLGEAMDLIDRAKAVMLREPNILALEAPLLAVGDLHGQFYDLLNLLEEGGPPGVEQYLFLGDYVDRGSFSCEVMFLLLALKVAYPDRVWLLRGNHECATVSGHFGFKQECKVKYGMNVYYRFLLLFQTMPLAAVIGTAYGDIFACHGGLSPRFSTLEEIEAIHRFVEPEADPAVLDILWSDPVAEEGTEAMSDAEYEAFMGVEWRSNPSRGCSVTYGYKALRKFLDTNNLVCVVRAHEVQEDGYKKHFDPALVETRIRRLLHSRAAAAAAAGNGAAIGQPVTVQLDIDIGDTDFPPLLTIFSAPNYCDRYQNKAAILRVDIGLDGFHAIQYECVPHPEPATGESQTENYILAIVSACPYMPTSLRNFVRLAVELGPDLEQGATQEPEPEPESLSEPPLSPGDRGRTRSRNIPMSGASPRDAEDPGLLIEALYRRDRETSVPVGQPRGKSKDGGFSYVVNPLKSLPDQVPADTSAERAACYKNIRKSDNQQRSRKGTIDGSRLSIHDAFQAALHSDAIYEQHPQRLPAVSLTPAQEIIIQSRNARGLMGVLASTIGVIKKTLAEATISPATSSGEGGSISSRGFFQLSGSARPPSPNRISQRTEPIPSPKGQPSDGQGTTRSSLDLHSVPLQTQLAQQQQPPTGTARKRHSIAEEQRMNSKDPEEARALKDRADKAAAFLQQYGVASVRLAGTGKRGSGSLRGSLTPGGSVNLSLSRKSSDSTMNSAGGESVAEGVDGISRKRLSSISKSSDFLSKGRKVLSVVTNADSPRGQGVASPSGNKFEEKEILGLKLMFSLFDRSGANVITHEDLVAYGEETGDLAAIRDAGSALEIVDIDGDGKIGLVDFIRFATRLKARWTREQAAAIAE